MAGMPGTGLGGVFYILLVLWMAVREVWLLGRGASNHGRWRKIANLATLSAAIIAALWLEGWLISELSSTQFGNASGLGGTNAVARELAIAAITPMIAIAPFVVLALLVAGIHAARWLLRRRRSAPLDPAANSALVERQPT